MIQLYQKRDDSYRNKQTITTASLNVECTATEITFRIEDD